MTTFPFRPSRLSRPGTTALAAALLTSCAAALLALSLPAIAQPASTDAGRLTFTADGRAYPGQHAAGDRALSVEIDGFKYRGHYQPHAASTEPLPNVGAESGAWGHAFLFASSAQVMRCQLNRALPDLQGTCQSADGRTFDLTSSGPPARP